MPETQWITSPQMARLLGVCERTLHTYRTDKESPWILGRHYRRSSPKPQSKWVWDSELTMKAWLAATEGASA
jgi:hypothetical protein